MQSVYFPFCISDSTNPVLTLHYHEITLHHDEILAQYAIDEGGTFPTRMWPPSEGWRVGNGDSVLRHVDEEKQWRI